MHGWKTAILALSLAVGLSACNSTDALTPQIDIPNAGAASSRASTPVTQSDAERLAYDNSDGMTARQNSASQAIATPRRSFGAQNTLQAQAEALERGSHDAAARSPEPAPAAPEPQQTARAAPQSNDSIRFLPIIGAPVQAVTPLSRQLGAEARSRGLSIKSSGDQSSQHILKGYFSAFSEGPKTTIVYVWDVLDNSGARLHRIQGQENVPGSSGEPWANVPASTMQTIATKTLQDYMSWRDSNAG